MESENRQKPKRLTSAGETGEKGDEKNEQKSLSLNFPGQHQELI